MSIFSSTITELTSNTMGQPYYQFNVANNKISIGDVSAMPVGRGDYSIEGLVRFNRLTGNTMIILGDSDNNANNFVRLMLFTEGNVGLIRFDGHTSSPNQYNWIISTPENVVSAGKWHHIVGVINRDTSGNCGIWVDGRKVSNTVSNLDGGANNHDFNNFNIGIDYANNYDFDGQIAKVRAFNFALSDTEVKELCTGASIPFKYKGANQTKLITNFSMETGGSVDSSAPTGWGVYGGSAVVKANTSSNSSAAPDPIDGSFHLRISGCSQYDGWVPTTTWDTVKDKRYRVSFWVYSVDRTVTGQIGLVNGAGAYAGLDTTFTWTSNTWTKCVYDYTEPAGGGSSKIYLIRTLDTASSQEFYCDDMTVVPIGAVAEYDGSGMHRHKWYDKSGNDLHGSISSATLENQHSYIISDGIRFHTSGKPSSDPATLDDYTEGTWSPSWRNMTVGNATQVAKYTKIGRMIHLYCKFTWGSTTSVSGNWGPNNIIHPDFENNYSPGICLIMDAGSQVYPAWCYGVTGAIYLRDIAGNAEFSATHPITWTTGDFIYFKMSYERDI